MFTKNIEKIFLFLLLMLCASILCPTTNDNDNLNDNNNNESKRSSLIELFLSPSISSYSDYHHLHHHFHSTIIATSTLTTLLKIDSNLQQSSSTIIYNHGDDNVEASSNSKLRSKSNITTITKEATTTKLKSNKIGKCMNNIIQKFIHLSLPVCYRNTSKSCGENVRRSSSSSITQIDEKFNISSHTNTNDSIVVSNQSIDRQQSTKFTDFVGPLIKIKTTVESSQDMLSFEEWRKKISEQMERENSNKQEQFVNEMNVIGQHNNKPDSTNEQKQKSSSSSIKMTTNRARNFASNECGAKIVDSNSEATFVNRILNEQMDEYMLNPCKIKNWFVIELCETIQPQYLEMANFELYSSVPKEFAIFASEHYPNRNGWSQLGNLTANDVRTIQGFKLQNNGFAKYIKIEFNSFYGSQHYCPISLIRIFGTSLFDEVERIDNPEKQSTIDFNDGQQQKQQQQQQHNSIYEEDGQKIDSTKNKNETDLDLFGSAKNAVVNVVRKAFNFTLFNQLLFKENKSKLNQSDIESFEIAYNQSKIVQIYPLFEDMMAECETYFFQLPTTSMFSLKNSTSLNIPNKCLFYHSLLFDDKQLFKIMSTQYFLRKYFDENLYFQCSKSVNETQITDSLLIVEKFVRLNKNNNSENLRKDDKQQPIILQLNGNDDLSATNIKSSFISSTMFAAGIISNSDSATNDNSPEIISMNITTKLEPSITEPIVSQPIATQSMSPTLSSVNNQHQSEIIATSSPVKIEIISTIASTETNDTNPSHYLDQLVNPSSETENDYQSLSSMSGQSKEAVIIRLTNRIKNLEKNISLMSTYLENLSVRYRKQMEEMQAIFNQTFDHFNTSARMAAEKDSKQQELIMNLQNEIVGLNNRFDNVFKDIEHNNWLFLRIHLGLMIIELTIVGICCLVFYLSFKHNLNQIKQTQFMNSPGKFPAAQLESNCLKLKNNPIIKQKQQSKKNEYQRSKSLSNIQPLIIHHNDLSFIFDNKENIDTNNNKNNNSHNNDRSTTNAALISDVLKSIN